MRQDDRGITLVEMIIAIAVSVIVIGAATLFIRNALRGYELAANTIDLQIEAQVLMEQLATWVMEGNYVDEVYNEDGNDVLIIYHIPRDEFDPDSESVLMGKRWMRVFWCEGNELYMYEEEGNGFEPPYTNIRPDPDYTDRLKNGLEEGEEKSAFISVISDCVEVFKVGPDGDSDDSVYSPNKVTVTLSLKAGIKKYVLENEIKMRNAAYEAVAYEEEASSDVP